MRAARLQRVPADARGRGVLLPARLRVARRALPRSVANCLACRILYIEYLHYEISSPRSRQRRVRVGGRVLAALHQPARLLHVRLRRRVYAARRQQILRCYKWYVLMDSSTRGRSTRLNKCTVLDYYRFILLYIPFSTYILVCKSVLCTFCHAQQKLHKSGYIHMSRSSIVNARVVRRAGGRAAVAGGGDAGRRGARVAGGRRRAQPLARRAGRARARLPLLQPVRPHHWLSTFTDHGPRNRMFVLPGTTDCLVLLSAVVSFFV